MKDPDRDSPPPRPPQPDLLVASSPRLVRGVYAITPDSADTDWLVWAVSQAAKGGVRWVQYRHKTATPAQRHQQARALRERSEVDNFCLIINDDLPLAIKVDAHGLHAGRDDGDPLALRQALGPQRILGLSCYAELSRLPIACGAQADYVAFGAFYPSSTKPLATSAPLSILQQVDRCRASSALPFAMSIVAIGGITAHNGTALVAAGAQALAVSSALFSAPDIAASARALGACFSDRV